MVRVEGAIESAEMVFGDCNTIFHILTTLMIGLMSVETVFCVFEVLENLSVLCRRPMEPPLSSNRPHESSCL